MNLLAFTYLGIAVYNTFKDDDPCERLMRYWFSLSDNPFGEVQAFDVRELRAAAEVTETGPEREEAILRRAIETGELAGGPAHMPMPT